MELADFHKKADETLELIAEKIENSSDDIEVDLLQGVLTIELPDGKQYAINKHEPTQQIWLSSPFSGAHRFSYEQASHSWQNPQKLEVNELLDKELKQ